MWAAGLALALSARISSTAEGSKGSGTKSSAWGGGEMEHEGRQGGATG